jgi:hypothetical protein
MQGSPKRSARERAVRWSRRRTGCRAASAGGASETVSADLKPGKYELLCFMAGHYAAGQKMPFEVKQ